LGLTEKERQQFDELGYVIKPGVYPESALQPLRDGLSNAVTAAGERLVHRAGFYVHTPRQGL
jgi:hypothetical protein